MPSFVDLVRIADAGIAELRTRAGAFIAGRQWSDERSVVEVEGWVNIIARERGKIVPSKCRDGKNIYTDTGREFLTQLMSLAAPGVPYRTDSVAYIGAGSGSQIEDSGVISLVSPAAYAGGLFLAPLDVPPTFPLTPKRTTVRYRRTFAESELTLSPGSRVSVSELGLFTNGSPLSVPTAYTPGSRDLTIANASLQAPIAYKNFEPIIKTDALELNVSWEVRF